MYLLKSTMQKLLLLILISLTNFIFADGGFYMGIGAGYSSIDGAAQSPYQFNNGSTGSQVDGSFATALYLGYDFNRWIGIQADYNAAWGTSNSNSYTLNQQLLGGSVLFHLPFLVFSNSLSNWDVFAKVGGDYNAINFGNVNPSCSNCVNAPSSVNGFTPLYGAGIEYGSGNVGYRLEWDYAGSLMAANSNSTGTSNGNQLNMTSNTYLLSILYHF